MIWDCVLGRLDVYDDEDDDDYDHDERGFFRLSVSSKQVMSNKSV